MNRNWNQRVKSIAKKLTGAFLTAALLVCGAGSPLSVKAAQKDFKEVLDSQLEGIVLVMELNSSMTVGEILGSANIRELSHLTSSGCFKLNAASTSDTEYLSVSGSGFKTAFTATKATGEGQTLTITFSADASCGGYGLYGTVTDYPISVQVINSNAPVAASPYERFLDKTIDLINSAEGNAVTLDADEFVSFSTRVLYALEKRPDLAFTINYRYEDKFYTLTIPAGADLSALMEDEYIGFRYIDSFFPGREIK